jgi:hypothetical protein
VEAVNGLSEPRHEQFTVSGLETNQLGRASLSAYDLQGRVVKRFNDLTQPLSVAELPAGVYLLRLDVPGQRADVQRLIVR